MPITLLDIIVLAVMLLSGLLAMIRGFMREILSIAAWGTAALVSVYAYSSRLLPMVQDALKNETLAKVALVGGVFILTLIVVSVITVRISDMILDSRIGALDRTLGFLFGLARGLLIMVVAFAFFDWLVVDKQQPDWVRGAKSKVFLQSTAEALKQVLPDDFLDTMSKKIKKKEDEQTDAAPDVPTTGSIPTADGGYAKGSRDGLKQLIEGNSVKGLAAGR